MGFLKRTSRGIVPCAVSSSIPFRGYGFIYSCELRLLSTSDSEMVAWGCGSFRAIRDVGFAE